ncbi:hypothetical protein GCM10022215_10470 [Nocardioides fonticola]|uniref:Glycosyl transferase family 2 n=1 Tax=Nocardioides fonticola TaxID=450363 RepID=A0ABP7XGI5_9ACTN
MLIAVSTVMDTVEHVRRHVAGNLAGGADHVVVFLDRPRGAGQAEVAAFLDEHPHATGVRAGVDWWGEERPRELNERQCTNANLAKQVLADAGLRGWVAHIDGDEILRCDRGVLDGLSSAQTAVRFAVRETVSRRSWDGEPTWFKRLLPDADLHLLHGLGLIAEPTNQAYLSGHLMGKSAARIEAPVWLTLHKVVDAAHVGLEPVEDETAFELFHYESYSAEEFARKWTAMVASGPRASYRAERRSTAATMRALINRGLEPAALERRIVAYYERFLLEDAEALHDLGVLVETDPLRPRDPARVPEPVAGDVLAAGFEAAAGRPKAPFFHGTSPGGRGLASAGSDTRSDARSDTDAGSDAGRRGWRRRS